MSRSCRQCRTSLGATLETCPNCGAFNRAERSLSVWLAGGAIVLVLFLALGDLGAVLQVAGNLLKQVHAALTPAP